MLVDTHCHLYFHSFDQDFQDVLGRARQAGIVRMLNPGIDLETSRKAAGLAQAYPEVFAAVGVHPNDALTWNEQTLEELRELAQEEKVAAIGEIGLDYYWDDSPHPLQKEVFVQQLQLACDLGLPVVIHTRSKSAQDRSAMADMLAILAEWHQDLVFRGSPLAERPGVLHSFSELVPSAWAAIQLNFYLGIAGPVTFRNAPELHQVVAELPLERLLIETDAPFLAPQPFRGKRNEPAYVRFVAERIAQIKNLSVESVFKATAENAGRLFQW